MSDDKQSGLGLFVNRKADAAGGAPPGPKNVAKRWMWVGAGVLGFSMLASSFFSSPPTPMPMKKPNEGAIDITPVGAEAKSWQVRSQSDIAALKDAVEKLKDENKRLAEDKARLANQKDKPVQVVPAGVVPPPVPPGSNMGALPPLMPPSPPVPPPSLLPKTSAAPAQGAGAASPAPGALADSGNTEALVFKADPPKASKGPANLDQVKAKVSYTANPYSGMLPAGSFAPVALLNGLDAGTSSANQANPQPVLVSVLDHATLPGSAKYRLKSCFVLSSAYGDLSAERVYFRLAQLSCIDKADRLVMTTPVQGYIVDSDGKLGMRGIVADRQGAKLGKAMLAGFAQGLGTAFGSAQGSTTSSVLGSSTSISGDAALKSAGLTGASTAASQLAAFYLKEAQNIFPVITVDAGRTGSMVFTQGVPLTWGQGDTLYQKEVKPE